MFDFTIKSNELNSETREQIKKILKNDDWVDALILLYKWVLKEDPNLEILGKRGRAVGFYSPYAGQKIFAVNIDENGDIKTGSSLLMKSLDYTFWDALEAVQKSHCQDIEQSDDWTLNHDHYMRLEKGTVVRLLMV